MYGGDLFHGDLAGGLLAVGGPDGDGGGALLQGLHDAIAGDRDNLLLLLFQVSLVVALEGLTVDLSVSVLPTTSVALVLFSFTCLGLISLPFSSVCVTGMLLDWAKVSAVLPEGVLISSFGQFIRLLSPIFSWNWKW